jgi:hypothetical protein
LRQNFTETVYVPERKKVIPPTVKST